MQAPLRLEWLPPPRAPTLFAACATGGALSPRHQERMAANLGAAVRVVSLDTCHDAMLERPEQVASTLNAVAADVITRAAQHGAGANRRPANTSSISTAEPATNRKPRNTWLLPRRCYREMDVGFWMEQAEAVLSSTTTPSEGPSRPLPHVEDVKAPPRQVEVKTAR